MSGSICGISHFTKQSPKHKKERGWGNFGNPRQPPFFHLSLDPHFFTQRTHPAPASAATKRERARLLVADWRAVRGRCFGVVLLVPREPSRDSAGEETNRNQLHRHWLCGCQRKPSSTIATRRAVEGIVRAGRQGGGIGQQQMGWDPKP